MGRDVEQGAFAAPPTAAQDRAIAARLENVTKDCRLDKVDVRALDGISCGLPQGQTIFVVGPLGQRQIDIPEPDPGAEPARFRCTFTS